jgi:hypothetical protein
MIWGILLSRLSSAILTQPRRSEALHDAALHSAYRSMHRLCRSRLVALGKSHFQISVDQVFIQRAIFSAISASIILRVYFFKNGTLNLNEIAMSQLIAYVIQVLISV